MGKKKKERAYQWMKKTRPARNLNSAPIQKHLVDLQTRVSSTLQSIQTAAFQLLLLSTILSSKDLSPSNVEQFVLFSRPFRSSMSKVPYEFAKIRGETRDPGQSSSRIVTTHSRADSTGWCVRVWPIASKLEIVPVNNASRGLETWRRKRSLV